MRFRAPQPFDAARLLAGFAHGKHFDLVQRRMILSERSESKDYLYNFVMWFVYILLCDDGSLYTGITNNPSQRLTDHRNGKGGRYTRLHKPLKILLPAPFNWVSKETSRLTKRCRRKKIRCSNEPAKKDKSSLLRKAGFLVERKTWSGTRKASIDS